jgi:protoheme IX farnesyltransferase
MGTVGDLEPTPEKKMTVEPGKPVVTDGEIPLALKPGDFAKLTKVRLNVMVLVTAFVGFWVGSRTVGFDGWNLVHTLVGTFLAALGSSVFNQLMELENDAKMGRTADRPLAAQRLPPAMAFALGWVLCALGMLHLGRMVNVEASMLAGLTLIIYMFVYTPMKQRSSLNTLVGAIAGAIPPMIGWVAAAGGRVTASETIVRWELFSSVEALFLFGLLFLWQLPHFVAINWMYREDYIRGGFVMWSNDDVSGTKTAKLAIAFSLALVALMAVPWLAGFANIAFVVGGGALTGVMVWFSFRFLGEKSRPAARRLFLYTLLYLPLVSTLLLFSLEK